MMNMLCFFDDEGTDNLQPLTLTRPAALLRMGILTLQQKWCHDLETHSFRYVTNAHVSPVYQPDNIPKNAGEIWINGRYLPAQNLVNRIKELPENCGLKENDMIVAVNLSHSATEAIRSFEELEQADFIQYESFSDTRSVTQLWDLFNGNGREIEHDIERISHSFERTTDIPAHVTPTHPHKTYIHKTAQIEPGVVLVAEDGPVVIGRNARVLAGSLLRGPLSIGDHALVKMGSKIYQDTTIGPYCKAGGEIKNCIFHSYSNKSHEGFVGNSLFGQWCNLGADTNTSNLKNNYSLLQIKDFKTGNVVETDQQFIGTIMGDHSKTAINTMLNTGTICGASSNIFCSGFPPKHIPSFRWMSDTPETYQFDKALITMEKVMKRRNITITSAYKAMMRQIFDNSLA